MRDNVAQHPLQPPAEWSRYGSDRNIELRWTECECSNNKQTSAIALQSHSSALQNGISGLCSFNIATSILSQRIKLLSYITLQMIFRGNLGYHRHQAKRRTSSANTRQIMRRTLCICVTESTHTTEQRQDFQYNRQAVPCTPKLAWIWWLQQKLLLLQEIETLLSPAASRFTALQETLLNICWLTDRWHSSVVS